LSYISQQYYQKERGFRSDTTTPGLNREVDALEMSDWKGNEATAVHKKWIFLGRFGVRSIDPETMVSNNLLQR